VLAHAYARGRVEEIWGVEASGTAKDTAGTGGKVNLKTSDMDGTTGVISAGWNYASPDNAYEMGFGLTGYAGARKGVTGEVRALWRF